MKEIIGYVILALVCFGLGALAVGLRASARIARAEARLLSADKIISLAVKVIGYLGLWDDHEFDELREAIDKHEED